MRKGTVISLIVITIITLCGCGYIANALLPDLPIDNGDLPIINGGLPINNGSGVPSQPLSELPEGAGIGLLAVVILRLARRLPVVGGYVRVILSLLGLGSGEATLKNYLVRLVKKVKKAKKQ